MHGRARGPNTLPHNRQHSVIQYNTTGPGSVPGHGNREDNGVLDILREIELQFKPNNRDLSGQPMQPHIANALYTKVEALFQHGRPLPAIKKLDTVETIRSFMEDPKGHEYEKYQSFEFIFDIAANRAENGRMDVLCNLLSYSISTSSSKMLDAGALWMKLNNKKYAIQIAEYLLNDFLHCSPPGGDLFSLHESCPRFACMIISTWGEIYRSGCPPDIVLELMSHWIENEPEILFQPISRKSVMKLWTTYIKPEHISSQDFISICALPSAIAWSIRLPFESEQNTAKFHWLILKSISHLVQEKIVKRIITNKSLPQNYLIWSRMDIRHIIGEMMNISKLKPEQSDKSGFAVPGSQLEKALDRFAQISQAVKHSGMLKDCSAAQFQSLCDVLHKTKLLDVVAGFQ